MKSPSIPRAIFLAVAVTLMSTGASASIPTVASYPAWKVTVGSFSINGAGGTLAIGSEIAHRIDGDIAGVRLVMRPVFENAPKSWPMVSVAGATLTFGRDGKEGGMVLTGDAMQSLAMKIPLDTSGRAVDALDVTMVVDRLRSVVELTVAGGVSVSTKLTIPVGSIAITVSSGATAPLHIERVELLSAAPISNDSVNSTNTVAKTLGSTQAKPAVPEPTEDDLRKVAFDGAMQLFRDKKQGEAEKKIKALSNHPANTIEEYLETAGNLTHVALALRQEYDLAGAIETGRRVLALLAEADKLPGKPEASSRAALFEMAGFVHEEILRDDEEAEKSYGLSAQLNDKAQRVTEALGRLRSKKSQSVPTIGK